MVSVEASQLWQDETTHSEEKECGSGSMKHISSGLESGSMDNQKLMPYC